MTRFPISARVALALGLAGALALPAAASAPELLNFSGRLMNTDGSAYEGVLDVTITLYADPLSTAPDDVVWAEIQEVLVEAGRFHVLLGADPGNALPLTALAQAGDLWVGVEPGVDGELSPRVRIASVPFALHAHGADHVGGLGPDDLAKAEHGHTLDSLEGTLAVDQLPAAATLDAELEAALEDYVAKGAEGAVTPGMIAEGAVTTAAISDGSVTPAKLSGAGCEEGQMLRFHGESWTCVPPPDGGPDKSQVEAWAEGVCFDTAAELKSAGAVLVDISDCTEGQVPLMTGFGWVCGDLPEGGSSGSGTGWKLDGNSNTPNDAFLGTLDDLSDMVIKAGGHEGLRLIPPFFTSQSPPNASLYGVNVQAGYHGNDVGSYVTLGDGVLGRTIAGGGEKGSPNKTGDNFATVGGGRGNLADGLDSVIAGGQGNEASGDGAVVPGGFYNEADGNFSFAGGRLAGTGSGHTGAFIWNGVGIPKTTTAAGQFLIYAPGGVGIGTNEPAGALDVAGKAYVDGDIELTGALRKTATRWKTFPFTGWVEAIDKTKCGALKIGVPPNHYEIELGTGQCWEAPSLKTWNVVEVELDWTTDEQYVVCGENLAGTNYPDATDCGENTENPWMTGQVLRMPLDLPDGANVKTIQVELGSVNSGKLDPGQVFSIGFDRIIAVFAEPKSNSYKWVGLPNLGIDERIVYMRTLISGKPLNGKKPRTAYEVSVDFVVDAGATSYFVDVMLAQGDHMALYDVRVEYLERL